MRPPIARSPKRSGPSSKTWISHAAEATAMLFERRVYPLKPGNADAFWQLQRQWNNPTSIPRYLAHNIGYFPTIAGPAEQVVHLYRHDSYDDWKSRLFGVYTAE